MKTKYSFVDEIIKNSNNNQINEYIVYRSGRVIKNIPASFKLANHIMSSPNFASNNFNILANSIADETVASTALSNSLPTSAFSSRVPVSATMSSSAPDVSLLGNLGHMYGGLTGLAFAKSAYRTAKTNKYDPYEYSQKKNNAKKPPLWFLNKKYTKPKTAFDKYRY